MKYTKNDIIRMVEEEDVEFIRLQFVDLFGTVKNIAITSSQLEGVLNNENRFPSMFIPDFMKLYCGELYLHPDLDTFTIFPWRPQQGKVARLICNIYTQEDEPFCGDTRMILKKAIKKAEDMGYNFFVGPECEFFLFHIDDDAKPTTITHERAGYLDVAPLDFAENVRRDIVLNLEEMGFEVERSFHSIAPAQHEVDFKHSDALKAADNFMTFKQTVKTISKRHGLHATFMPKPREDLDGSAMHIKLFLKDMEGNNVFYDENDENKLSQTAYYFMAGILKHIDSLSAITNPLVNSYKRLVPGFNAPVYATWSRKMAGQLIYVRESKSGNVKIELRSPDPTANPYLAFALCLMAGLDGIENHYELPDAMNTKISGLSEAERESMNIKRLPENIRSAVDALSKDELFCELMGREVVDTYIEQKKNEWLEYSRLVTKWETEKYLNIY